MTLLPDVRAAALVCKAGPPRGADLLRKTRCGRRAFVDGVSRFAQTAGRAGKPSAAHPEAPRASPFHRPAKESLMSKTMPDSAPAAVSAAA